MDCAENMKPYVAYSDRFGLEADPCYYELVARALINAQVLTTPVLVVQAPHASRVITKDRA